MRKRGLLSIILFSVPGLTTQMLAQTDAATVSFPIENGKPDTRLGLGYYYAPISSTICAEARDGRITLDQDSHNEVGSLRFTSNTSDVRKSQGFGAEVSGGYGPFSASGSYRSYRTATESQAFNRVFVRTLVHVRGEKLFDTRLTQRAAALLETDPTAFLQSCGFAYVAGMDYGGEFIGEVFALYSRTSEQSEAETNVKAALSGVGSGSVQFSNARTAMGSSANQRAQYYILGNVRAPASLAPGDFVTFALRFGSLVQANASSYSAHTAPYAPAMLDLCQDQALCYANLQQIQSKRPLLDSLLQLHEQALNYVRIYQDAIERPDRYAPTDLTTLESQRQAMEDLAARFRARIDCEFAHSCSRAAVTPVPMPPAWLAWKGVDVTNSVPTCVAGFEAGISRLVIIRGRYANSARDVRAGRWRSPGHPSIRIILHEPDSNRGARSTPIPVVGPVGEVCVGVQSGGANNRNHPRDRLMFAVYYPARPLFPSLEQLTAVGMN